MRSKRLPSQWHILSRSFGKMFTCMFTRPAKMFHLASFACEHFLQKYQAFSNKGTDLNNALGNWRCSIDIWSLKKKLGSWGLSRLKEKRLQFSKNFKYISIVPQICVISIDLLHYLFFETQIFTDIRASSNFCLQVFHKELAV